MTEETAETAASRSVRNPQTDYGFQAGDRPNWHSWQVGRAWARQHEFYGIPAWCANPYLRGFVMGNALLAPLLLILWAVTL